MANSKDITPNLHLPYLIAAQAQKHVTHNEAIRSLDAVVQLSVVDRAHTAPPATPAEGERYIVAGGATGVFADHVGQIAAWQDGGWLFRAATTGWIAYVAAENIAVVWTGSAWIGLPLSAGSIDNADHIGVNAVADATNRLSVSAAATLLNHAGAGHQLKINKAASEQTASLLFQDAFSGRAEVGLAGDDNLHVKVSADGATWRESIVVDRTSGVVSFPSGATGLATGAGGGATFTPLLVLTGESNSGGNASNADATAAELATRSSVQILNNTTLAFEALHVGVNSLVDHAGLSGAVHSWEIGIANAVEAGRFQGLTSLYMVKAGQGGSTLSQWSTGNATGYWTKFISRTTAALAAMKAANVRAVPFVLYSQGINDAIAGTDSVAWKAATVAHFAKIRAQLGYCPILMTLLPSPAFDTYNARILEIAAADAFVFPITTSDLPLQDDLNHWTYIGQRVIGARMVDKIQYGTGSAITDYFEAQNLAFMTNTPVQVAAGVATPVITPAGGSHATTQTVSISTATAGAAIYVTTNGAYPTTTSPIYSGPLTIAASATVKAVAVKAGRPDSMGATSTYTIGGVVATPTFSPAAGSYVGAQTVSISCATSGATIRYTTDGSTPTATSALYAAALALSASTTLKAMAMKSGSGDSAVASAVYTIVTQVATPTFSPAAGSYAAAQTIVISTATAGAVIHYTTDGSTPTAASPVYSAALAIGANTTVNAIATLAGLTDSPVASAVYAVNLGQTATPAFSPAAGSFTGAQSVVISCATAGATITYTTDGSTPTTSSSVYSGAITMAASGTVKAIAVAAGYSTSAVASSVYTITLPQVATPTFTPAAGTFASAQSVAIACATAGAAIYYTTNGSTPTTASAPYTGAISVGASATLKALAVKAGNTDSAIASAAYTIGSSTNIVSWTAMTAASQVGSYLVNANATPSGGRALQTIDATLPFSVQIEMTGANSEGVVVYLDDDATSDYAWSAANAYLAGCYHYSTEIYWTMVGGSATSALSGVAFPTLVGLVKSGNDVLLQRSTNNGASWTTFNTLTGALAGKTTIYLKVLFAIGGASKQIKVSITA